MQASCLKRQRQYRAFEGYQRCFCKIGMLPMLSAVHTHNLDLGGVHLKLVLSQIADNI